MPNSSYHSNSQSPRSTVGVLGFGHHSFLSFVSFSPQIKLEKSTKWLSVKSFVKTQKTDAFPRKHFFHPIGTGELIEYGNHKYNPVIQVISNHVFQKTMSILWPFSITGRFLRVPKVVILSNQQLWKLMFSSFITLFAGIKRFSPKNKQTNKNKKLQQSVYVYL